MFKYSVSRVIYPLLACAVLFHAHAAHADSLPTVTITSASGSAFWGNPGGGPCLGICAGLASPIFTLGTGGDFVPASYFQADPGTSFNTLLGLEPPIGPPADMSGSLVFDGKDYPVAYQDVVVTPAPFIVPYGGTIEVPALLTGTGTACTTVYPGIGCYPNSPTAPFPVMIANVDLDIPGYLTFTFYKAPELSPSLGFTATFNPVPEPSTVLLVLPALALIWVMKKGLTVTYYLLVGLGQARRPR